MKTAFKLTILMLLIGTGSFAQSKKDLEVKISKQQKTIDSLNAVIANMENIIENRDRSIKIYAADEEKYVKSLSDFNIALDNCRNQKATLQSQNAYGVAKIMPMNNSRSTLKVKAGHTTTINQFMGDYTSNITTDSIGNAVLEEIHVFIKEIDGTVLTDVANKKFGPKVFSSLHPEATINLPIVLTEGTTLKVAVYKGTLDNLIPYEGVVLCSFTEKEN
jgi:hypothetical protein